MYRQPFLHFETLYYTLQAIATRQLTSGLLAVEISAELYKILPTVLDLTVSYHSSSNSLTMWTTSFLILPFFSWAKPRPGWGKIHLGNSVSDILTRWQWQSHCSFLSYSTGHNHCDFLVGGNSEVMSTWLSIRHANNDPNGPMVKSVQFPLVHHQ